MEAVDEYPPESLKGVWSTLPEEAKQWVRDTVVIDHIDADPSNNTLDNLRYVTPKENNAQRKAVHKLSTTAPQGGFFMYCIYIQNKSTKCLPK